MKLCEEFFTEDFFKEAALLIAAHGEETNYLGEEFSPDPDVDLHVQLGSMGLMRLFTARSDDGELAGYLVYVVAPNMQFKTLTIATQTALFIAPEFRKTNAVFDLIRMSEEVLGPDVQMIYQHTTEVNDIGRLYESMGYFLVEKFFMKKVGK